MATAAHKDVEQLASALLFAQVDAAVVLLTADREFRGLMVCCGDVDDVVVPIRVDAPDQLVGLLSLSTVLQRAMILDPSGSVREVVVAAGAPFVAALALGCDDEDEGAQPVLRAIDVVSTPDAGPDANFRPRCVAAGILPTSGRSVMALPWGSGVILTAFGNPNSRPQVVGPARSPWKYMDNTSRTALRTVSVAIASDFVVGGFGDGSVTLWDVESGAVLRDLGVVLPGSALVAAVASHGRLCMASQSGTVKFVPLSGVATLQSEAQLRLSRAQHFPATGLGSEVVDGSSGDGFCVAIHAVTLLDDQTTVAVVTTFGVGVLSLTSLEWNPMYYFDAAVSRASMSSMGCISLEYALDNEAGALLQLDPDVLMGPARVAMRPPDAESVPGALANGLVLPAVSDEGDTDDANFPVVTASFIGGHPIPTAWLEPLEMKKTAPAPGGKGAKPVTFGHRIKSSGYTNEIPWSVQQQRKAAAKKKLVTQAKAGPRLELDSTYDMTAGPIMGELVKTSALLDAAAPHTGAVTGLAYGACGAVAVTSSVDMTCFAMRQPPGQWKGEGWCLKGHAAPVLCCDASQGDGSGDATTATFATGSSDGEVRVWRPSKRTGAALIKSHAGKEIRAVKFLCDDRLLAAAIGGTLSISRFVLDLQVSDLDRQKNDSRSLEVRAVPSGAQAIHTVDAIGYSRGSKVVMGTSAKSVCIVDVALGEIVSAFSDAHGRPVHSVTAFSSSQFARLPTPCHDLVASASYDGTVKLWDVRVGGKAAVRSFSSHANSSLKVGLAPSPCGRYLAVGSEDRSVFIYDVAQGTAHSRVPVPDVPSALRYNPLAPRLLVGTNSGALRLLSPLDA